MRTLEDICKEYYSGIDNKQQLRNEEESLEREIPIDVQKGFVIRKKQERLLSIERDYQKENERLNEIVNEMLDLVASGTSL